MTQNSINNSASDFQVDNINLNGNTISTTNTNGNLVLSPNGTGTLESNKGISFDSGTNVLSQYETGSWTPVLTFGGGNTGMVTTNTGLYTRIGDQCFIEMHIIMSTKGSSTGANNISGLPFTSQADWDGIGSVYSHRLTFSGNYLSMLIGPNSTDCNVEEITTGIGGVVLGDAAFNVTPIVIISNFFYRIA